MPAEVDERVNFGRTRVIWNFDHGFAARGFINVSGGKDLASGSVGRENDETWAKLLVDNFHQENHLFYLQQDFTIRVGQMKSYQMASFRRCVTY